ncbi:MAG: [Bacteroidales bacterium]|nr:[FeFe] hydrogenase H-cluster maturation GTPase HydF [Bacteroidales bacterium]
MKGNELKPRIGVFGRRNYGKSTLVNFITNQQVSIVSPTAGTTTDAVRKTMEIIGVGPVVWVDTAGVDDCGELGLQRVAASRELLGQTDLALIVVSHNEWGYPEQQLVDACRGAGVPMRCIYTLADQYPPTDSFLGMLHETVGQDPFVFTAKQPSLRAPLLQVVRESLPESAYAVKSLLGDVLRGGDNVVLVTPIDEAAPTGRLILPQVQVIRDVLDCGAVATVCKETELERTLALLREPPRLVVTDSQAFALVDKVVPPSVALTSFSIVLARAKGLFDEYAAGTCAIANLRESDRVLMLESCTHNVTCDDIGRVKLPALLRKFTGKDIRCEAVAGLSRLDRPLTDYALVIQCGGCVASPKQLVSRLSPALQAGIPVSNYGMAIAYMNGIFDRAMQLFSPHQ